jgi:hypothetical protein
MALLWLARALLRLCSIHQRDTATATAIKQAVAISRS